MRVISGYARGHKLLSPKGLDIRPTTDRVKESIFSMIHNKINGTSFLDLFSGTGAIGIEALSRGSKSCVFVDRCKESVEIINYNIKHVSKAILNPKYEIINLNVNDALNILKNKKFDIIFMDPPYKERIINNILKIIYQNNILNDNGIIIIEQDKNAELPVEKEFEIFKNKEYGLTTIIFMKPSEEL